MFPTFSGSSRRPRNVNLSGRPNTQSNLAGTQNALANAQQNRIARQQERERAHAATVVQRRWRIHTKRKSLVKKQRATWDEVESLAGLEHGGHADHDQESIVAYKDDNVAHTQLQLLLRFLNLRHADDFTRLRHYITRWQRSLQEDTITSTSGPWPLEYLRLSNVCLASVTQEFPSLQRQELLRIARLVVTQMKRPFVGYMNYYDTLRRMADFSSLDVSDILEPLRTQTKVSQIAYDCFSRSLLEFSGFREVLGQEGFDFIASEIDCGSLGEAVTKRLQRTKDAGNLWSAEGTVVQRLWLLGHIIYIYRYKHETKSASPYTSDRDFVFIVGTLLSSLVNFMDPENSTGDGDPSSNRSDTVVSPFIRDQISSLVNQESIAAALTLIEPQATSTQPGSGHQVTVNNGVQILTNYILTLLRLFPRRGDEIRMWLYLGVLPTQSTDGASDRSSVIRYFWRAASNTEVYAEISRDPRQAIVLVKPRARASENATTIPMSWLTSDSGKRYTSERNKQASIDNQWRVIVMFVEMYMFVLKIMDDEQFFSGANPAQIFRPTGQTNALLLTEVQALTIFLKNLGFTLYYNSKELMENRNTTDEDDDIGRFFRVDATDASKSASTSAESRLSVHVAGVQGMSIDYVKGLVTGLVRAIYERDSRRPFLPKNHWLMISRFDMTNFIDAVVEEEERRHKVQEEEDDDMSDEEISGIESTRTNLVGTWHAQRTRMTDQLQRQRRKVTRMHYLQKVAPRLEILQNMPFFIPFTTRVQIFRRFIALDTMKIRPSLDFDIGVGMNARHHAKIRREHEFEDAFQQFYKLGPALKEQIRITFVDQFDTVEAGIDGGGVTKEFLTSVTNQAFRPTDGINMFAENDHHLLYPNPSAIEEQKVILADAGLTSSEPEYREQIGELLKRYEFLGRIIGKCLYEGILVDIGFASFFLLKWALTGGAGSAPRESGYRANINDLRDFDEGLYQGLIQLKNYPGNVEDFSLNFTVTDTIPLPSDGGPRDTNNYKTVTHDLVPNGSNIAVTNANRLVYISYMARHRLQYQPQAQTDAFLRGLASIIQPSWLSMFNQSELQTLVGGAAVSISVLDLRANTVYGGVYVIGDDGQEHPSVRLFWEVMEELGEEDRRKVLKFVTSTPRAPLLGFGSLNPKFSIRDAGADESRLPSTSTCVNLLKLPRYSRRGTLRKKLLQAVNAGAGFDLS